MDVPEKDEKELVLFDAVKSKDLGLVSSLIDAGADVNVRDGNGQTALMVAADVGSVECVAALIYETEDLNLQDENGDTALHIASRGGHTASLLKLKVFEPDLNVRNKNGETPICCAIMNGHIQCMNIFINGGATFDFRNEDDSKCLCIGVKRKHYECLIVLLESDEWAAARDNDHVNIGLSYAVRLLDEHPTNLEIKNVQRNSAYGYASLYYAGILSLPECLNAVIETGLDVNKRDRFGYTPIFAAAYCGNVKCVDAFIKAGADVNLRDEQGRSALTRSIANGYVDCVRTLVEAGTDINVKIDGGETDIFITAQRGLVACMDILIEAGADVNVQDYEKKTPLIAAALGNHKDCINNLLRAGADVNAGDTINRTAVVYAADYGFKACVESLIIGGANVYARDHNNNRMLNDKCLEQYRHFCDRAIPNEDKTAIVFAAWKGQNKVVADFIESGIDINVRWKDGTTALIAASWEGHSDCVDVILRADKVDVNAEDCRKRTALFAASYGGHFECVKRILAHENVKIEVKDFFGSTPLMMAARKKNSNCLNELISAGASIHVTNDNGWTALEYATICGSEQCVRSLIQARAKFDQRTLIQTVIRGHAKCLEILLELVPISKRADPDMKQLIVHPSSKKEVLFCLPTLLKAGVFNWSWYTGFAETRILVRELIIHGYAPEQFKWNSVPCSPLLYALCIRDKGMVKFLMANLYLTPLDMSFFKNDSKLSFYNRFRDGLHEMFHGIFTASWRLEALSFLRISFLLRTGIRRRHEAIDKSELTNLLPLKFLMMLKFQTSIQNLCVKNWDNIQGDPLNFRKPAWLDMENLRQTKKCFSCSSKCIRLIQK